MQEDRQPNETRTQRKGDHRVPKVRSSASQGPYRHRKLRFQHPPRSKTEGPRRDLTHRDRDEGFVITSDNYPTGPRSHRRREPPPLRGPIHAQDRSATNRRATGSIPSPLASTTASCPESSTKTSLTNDALHVPGPIANTQKDFPSSPELVIGSRRSDGGPRILKNQSPPRFIGHRSQHSDSPVASTSHNGKWRFHLKPPGISPGIPPPVDGGISTQLPTTTTPDKRETPEPQFIPTTLLQKIYRERSVMKDPDDTIDLTLSGSDDERLDTPVQRPHSTGSDSVQGALVGLTTQAYPPSERPFGNSSTYGFPTGPIVIGPPLNLVKDPRDKPRLFVRYTLDFEACLANVSAHGFVDQICTVPQWGREVVRSPEHPALEFVHGACVLNAYGSALLVLAHARESLPVTIHRLAHQSPIRPIGTYERPTVHGKQNGLTAICSMMQPLSFATGGADHAIHIWNVDRNLQTTRSGLPLAIRHTSQIHSLLPIQDSSHKLISSGADCNVNVYDLPSERVVNVIKLSNPGFHVHRTDNPWNLLIQTAHREHQFEIRDLRTRSTAETLTFGFPSENPRLSKFARGDVARSTLFACGDLEGCVHIWDLRNVKRPSTQTKCFQTKINNVIWHESHLLASSHDNNIAAIPYASTNSIIESS